MQENKSATKRFRIRAQIKGVPPSAYIAGYLETKDTKMIAKLRALPENEAVEVLA